MSERGDKKGIEVTSLVTQPDRSLLLRVRCARLEVIAGPDVGAEMDVAHTGVLIGAGAGCDLVLADVAVSRRHLEIVPEADGYRLRDLGSKNGTMLHGLLVTEVKLLGSCEIHVGKSTLRFVVLDEHKGLAISQHSVFGPLLGESLGMRQVFAVLERAAEHDFTLLLEGESGVGKDLAAEAVHRASARKEAPFVVVDCAAINQTLAESELFGHLRGAFTGADHDRVGAFQAAQGGTVFIDEIGELEPKLQPKLLRLLERREVRRVGENTYRPVDVRIIAATNRDLEQEVAGGRFRQDLFYRLSVVRLRLPPLRDRVEDIEALARLFVEQLRSDMDPTQVITPEVLTMLQRHSWPGNVRELRNVTERLLIFPDAREAELGVSRPTTTELPADYIHMNYSEARTRWTDQFERAYLQALLNASGGVVTEAAQRAGITRRTFHRLLAKQHIQRS